jgi:hypothetical protein
MPNRERRQKLLKQSSSFRLLLAGLLVAIGLAFVASEWLAIAAVMIAAMGTVREDHGQPL